MLLICNNTGDYKYPNKILWRLQQFITHASQQDYTQCKAIQRDIYHGAVTELEQFFLSKMESLKQMSKIDQDLTDELIIIFLEDFQKGNTTNLAASEYAQLMTIYALSHMDIIATFASIQKELLERRKYLIEAINKLTHSFIPGTKGHYPELQQAIHNQEVVLVNYPQQPHAEVGVLAHIVTVAPDGHSVAFQPDTLPYIGIAKFCCLNCYSCVEATSALVPDSPIVTRGTHFGLTPDSKWSLPPELQPLLRNPSFTCELTANMQGSPKTANRPNVHFFIPRDPLS